MEIHHRNLNQSIPGRVAGNHDIRIIALVSSMGLAGYDGKQMF
jgi:hypothetical protein